MKLIIATTAIALSAGAAFAEDAIDEVLELPKPEIAFVDAANTAAGAAAGDLVGMELDYINEDDPVYVADLEADTSFSRLMIDGDTGEVLVTESVIAQDEAALQAYLEQFSTQAEFADMLELNDMIHECADLSEVADVAELDDLSDEELAALEELFEALDDEALLDEGAQTAPATE